MSPNCMCNEEKKPPPVMNKAHPHAALMLLFAQDAAETDLPWERWEYRSRNAGQWISLEESPLWLVELEYRRKKPTRVVNGFEVPAPLTKPIPRFWLPDPLCSDLTWEASSLGKTAQRYFNLGLAFATREEAIMNAKAMCGIDPYK